MDKNVKIILGLAIAILFPIFVWFAVYTFIPDPKVSEPEYPKYPEAPNCRIYSSNYSEKDSRSANVSSNYNRDCQYRFDRYNQKVKDHDAELKEYEQELKKVDKQDQQVVVWRAQFALVLALFGMLAVVASASVVGVAAGLAGGAAVTIVIAVSFLIPSLFDGTKVGTELSIILLLTSFALLTAELWYIDNILYRKDEGQDDLTGPSFSQRDDGVQSSQASNINPDNLKESVIDKPIEPEQLAAEHKSVDVKASGVEHGSDDTSSAGTSAGSKKI